MNCSYLRNLAKDKSGVSAVEFALVLPLLVVMLMGIVEFALLLYDKAVITNAAREGARAGIVFRADPTTGAPDYLDSNEIKTVVDQYLAKAPLISLGSETTYTLDPPPVAGLSHGDPVTVTVNYGYTFLLVPDFLTYFFPKGKAPPKVITLSAQCIMRLE